MADRLLAILRHGKAERDSPTGMDADRPLAARGARQAEWMGGQLAEAGFGKAAVFASPAARTWSTAEIVADALGTAAISDDRLFT
ncbi:MAG: histidine phosphatase family protein, partial [Planctomycetota bacterium]